MRFRFVLSHPESGNSLETSEFDGWKESTMRLERDENFHSIIEYFDGSFILYGNNGVVNGGIDFVKSIERDYGFDTTIVVTIDLTYDEVNFISVFIGQYKLVDLEEMPNNKMRIPIVRDDFWTKFISRLDIPVDLRSALNQDGTPVDVHDYVNMILPSQKVRYEGSYNWLYSETYYDDGNSYFGLQLDWDEVVIDDLKKFTLPRVKFDIGGTGGIATNLIGNFEAPYDGEYTFDIRIEYGNYFDGTNTWALGIGMNWWVQNPNQEEQINFFTETAVVYGSDTIIVATYNETHLLRRGDQIAIYGNLGLSSQEITVFGNVRLQWKVDADLATRLNIVLSGEQTIDGILTNSSTVLVKNQGNKEENGIYISSAGAWTRATDSDTASELNNAAVFVTAGDTQANTAWRQDETITTLGVDPIVWTFTFDSDERFRPYPGTEVDNHLRITADTTFKNSDADGFLIHDAFAAVTDRIIGQNSTFYSELLGSSLTTARQYEEDGCAWTYILFKGLQLREYTLSEKPFFLSLNQAWRGANPIFNLSLGYEEVEGEQVIRLEEKAYQYDDSAGTSIDFSNIEQITRKYDNERIFNKIEIGYARWQAEDISGIDDPQSKKVYTDRLQKSGKTITLHSEFMAASIPIEQARRTSRVKSSDYKYDNEVFIISINPNAVDVSPDESPDVLNFAPELAENFNIITNLLNSDTRYNLRLTVARNFLRWQNYLQGCLQDYLGSEFKFASGEGNYDMTSEMDDDGCLHEGFNGEVLDEKGNIPVTDDFLHTAHLYEAEFPMEWEEYEIIRNNRRKPIGISKTDSGHVPMFIKDLQYKPAHGSATVLMWAKEYLDLGVFDDTTPMRECYPSVECEDALTDEDGNILTDELGVCITE